MYSLKEEKISQLTPFSVLADNKRIRNKIIEGKSTQETRSGKNWFDASKIDNSNIVVSDNGKTITMPISSSGGYTSTNVKLSQLCPSLKVGDAYFLYFKRNVDSAHNRYIYLQGINEVWTMNSSKVITQEMLDSTVIMYGNNANDGETEQVVITDFRIVKNENDEWEQYGVSPSPEFPSEIHSLGDDVNLFDKTATPLIVSSGSPYVDILNTGIKLTATTDGEYKYVGFELDVNKILSKTITVKADMLASALNKPFISLYWHNNGTLTNRGGLTDIAMENSGTNSTLIPNEIPEGATGIVILFYVNRDGTGVAEDYVEYTNIKLQIGNKATAYSEYGKGTVEIKQSGKNLAKPLFEANFVTDYIPVKKDETYIYSESGIGTTSFFYFYETIGGTGTYTYVDANVNWTATKNGYIRINKSTSSKSEIMLEKGIVVTEYEPYKANNYVIPLSQPLRSLPNGIKDTIEEDGIHRRVGRKLITADDVAQITTNYTVPLAWILKKEVLNMVNSNANKTALMKSYKEKEGTFNANTVENNKFNVYWDKYYVLIADERFTDLETAKSLLEGEEIIYQLAEEVIEPFDEEQQAVMNKMETFEGINYFSLAGNLEATLTFDYNPQITEEIKRAFKYNITKAYLEVAATDKASGFQINEDNYLQSIDFDDCRYIEGEGIIGSCVAKELQGKFVNVDTSFDIENREVECFIGAETEDKITHYLKLGTFIVQKPENDNVKENTSFYSLDYMIKFNKEYIHRMAKYFKTEDTDVIQDKKYYILNDNGEYEEVIVPHKEELSTYYEVIDEYTLMQLLKDICEQCEVKLGTFNFRNADYVVQGNRFDSGVTCRDVLKAIAQAAFSWARINEYNELLLDFETSDTITEEIDYNEYYNLSFNDNYGPVNTIVLKNSQAEGENITIKNDKLINSAGGKNLLNIFDENWKLYYGIKQADGSIKANINDNYYMVLQNYSDEWKNYIMKNKGKTLTFSCKELIENYSVGIVIFGNRTSTTVGYQVSESVSYGIYTANNISIEIANDFIDINHIELRMLRKYPIETFTDTTTVISQLQLEEGPITTNYEEFIPLGTKELAISDNPFAYSEETRKAIIQAGEAIYGFKYVPLSVETIGAAYLNCKDKLKVKNMQDGDLETYIFDTRISYQGAIKSNVETLAMTDTETKYRYDGSLTTAQRRTEFRVDKAEQKMTSLIKQTTEQGERLTKATQDLEGFERIIENTTDETNKRLVKIEETVDGLVTNKSVSGGQNLIKNSVGYFKNDYWQINDEEEGNVLVNNSTDVKQNSISGSALNLQAETIYQDIKEIKNGEYYLSFSYKKIIDAAIATLKINDLVINLTETDWTEEEHLINVTTNNIKIEMTTDLNSSILITDLMLTEGNLQVSWTQNANESYTDTVQIGKGVRITATGSDTEFLAQANGITINNTENGNKVAEFTKYGTETQELIAHKDVKIADSLLIQKIGNQTWFSSL